MPGNVQEKHITMKKAFIITLLHFIALNLYAQKEFTIRGTVTNVEDGSIFHLTRSVGRVLITIAQDTIVNGKFTVIIKKEDFTCGMEIVSPSEISEIEFTFSETGDYVKSGDITMPLDRNLLLGIYALSSLFVRIV